MLRAKLAAFASALILAGTAFAGQEVCPELSAIQSEGVSMSVPIFGSYFGAYELSTFNTDTNWGFIMAPIEADSEEDSLEIANEILADMTAPGVPQDLEGAMVCAYDTGASDILAVAVKDSFPTPMKLKQLIQRVR